jgi:hypothetical protein
MGKKGGAIIADKKGKKAAMPPTIAETALAGVWDRSKLLAKDMKRLLKDGHGGKNSVLIREAGSETMPSPPTRFRVMHYPFILCGAGLLAHAFLRGLVFVYGVQLHDLNPNTVLQIACFVTLCECFLGINPHWAPWKRLFGVKRWGLDL